MSAIVINDINVNFEVTDERVFISSLELSEVFEKNHAHVLRTINKLPDDEFKSQNFIKHSYLDKTGRVLPCYNLTRDGFSLLVMGFTGQKAYQWKVEFIKAFNTMEAELKRQSISHYVDKIASLEAVRISQAKHHENVVRGYKSQIAQHNEKIKALENKNEILSAEIIEASDVENKSKREARSEALQKRLSEVVSALCNIKDEITEVQNFAFYGKR